MTTRNGRGWAAARPHGWPCRHCGMVDDYRLLRQAQLEHAEGGRNRDEDYRLITFKDWLRAYQWEQPPATTSADEPLDDAASATDNVPALPQQRSTESAVDAARRAVSAIPDPDQIDAPDHRHAADDADDWEARCRV